MAVNFLYVNGENYFIIVCFSKIAATITASRKLVKMGRKFCLFVYYVELIGIKLWMVEEGVAWYGGLEIWTVEGKDKKGNSKAMQVGFYSFMISIKRW
jgi:hypothetical protein